MLSLQQTDNNLNLEAPGDLLSELLGVHNAVILKPEAETVRTLGSVYGQWYILAPEQGTVNVAWEDQTWMLSVPQAAVFPGEKELTLLAGEACSMRLLILSGTAADRVLSSCQGEGGLFFEKGGLAMEHFFTLLSSRGSASPVSAREASEAAYALLMALYGTQSAGPAEGRRLPGTIEAALGIIRSDYAFLDGIGELAERLEVSQEYLTRSFCRYIGIPPGKYLNRVRIENACRLLRQGGYSVQFVSEACGFTNANYFARVFRAAVGMNPAEYARRQPIVPAQQRDESLYVL